MEISENKKQKIKKYAVFSLMGIICAASIYFLFAPSESDLEKQSEGLGLNMEVPQPKKDGIVDDKLTAYNQQQMEDKKSEKMQSLQDWAFMLGGNTQEELAPTMMDENGFSPIPDADPMQSKNNKVNPNQNGISNSVKSYQDIHRTLGNFYEQPKNDPEKEKMSKELETLKAELQAKDNTKDAMEDQLAFMEKSYQLAAKYMPAPTQSTQSAHKEGLSSRITQGSISKKTKIVPIAKKQKNIVSQLPQYLNDDDLFVEEDQQRNESFNQMQNLSSSDLNKNTIEACIDGDQKVTDGQLVRLRILEEVQAGTTTIPENTLVIGTAKIQGERLSIQVTNIEYKDYIIRTSLQAFDSDGQKGLNIPGSMEVKALKEVVANMGNNLGTSITLSQSAGQQIASDLSKGLIQGTSQLFAKKIQQVKITIKSGHKLYLMPSDND